MTERNKFTPEQETWLKALESGQYAQGHDKLKLEMPAGGFMFCCLGLACELGLATPDGDNHYLESNSLHMRDGRGGLAEAHKIDGVNFINVAHMNDRFMSFAQIAAFIRANPHQVFTNFDVPAQP